MLLRPFQQFPEVGGPYFSLVGTFPELIDHVLIKPDRFLGRCDGGNPVADAGHFSEPEGADRENGAIAAIE